MSQSAIETRTHFHKAASQFDDLYESERRGPLRRAIDSWLRASIYRRFELTFESLGDLAGKRILDVGCGGGRYSVMAGQLGAQQVLGVDFAPNMIELARELANREGLHAAKVGFLCGDVTATSFDQPFDAAIVMGVMDYVREPGPFLREILDRVTGRIVVSFPVKYSVWTPQRFLRYRLIKNCPIYFYSRARLGGILTSLSVSSYEITDAHRDYVAVIDK